MDDQEFYLFEMDHKELQTHDKQLKTFLFIKICTLIYHLSVGEFEGLSPGGIVGS